MDLISVYNWCSLLVDAAQTPTSKIFDIPEHRKDPVYQLGVHLVLLLSKNRVMHQWHLSSGISAQHE